MWSLGPKQELSVCLDSIGPTFRHPNWAWELLQPPTLLSVLPALSCPFPKPEVMVVPQGETCFCQDNEDTLPWSLGLTKGWASDCCCSFSECNTRSSPGGSCKLWCYVLNAFRFLSEIFFFYFYAISSMLSKSALLLITKIPKVSLCTLHSLPASGKLP